MIGTTLPLPRADAAAPSWTRTVSQGSSDGFQNALPDSVLPDSEGDGTPGCRGFVASLGEDGAVSAALAGLEEICQVQRGLEEQLAGLARATHSVRSALAALGSEKRLLTEPALRGGLLEQVRPTRAPVCAGSEPSLHVSLEIPGPQSSDGTGEGVPEKYMTNRSSGSSTERSQRWPSERSDRRSEVEIDDFNISPDWPANLKLQPCYKARPKNQSWTKKQLSQSVSQMFTSRSASMELKHWVLSPQSRARSIVDFLSLFVLVYDLFIIPVVLAWDIEFRGWILWTAVAGLVFWTVDIVINFRSAVFVHGTLEKRPRQIARHYLKTWFVPDATVVFADWVSVVLLMSVANAGTSIKVLRFVKIGRALRLAGMLKIRRLYDAVERLVSNHFIPLLDMGASTIKMFAAIIWANHIICCMWYAIGGLVDAESTDTGLRWVDQTIGQHSDITYRDSAVYAYFTAFHWSLTQMTPGSMQVHPLNSIERQFSIFCLLVGMIFFSSLVSSVSSKMVEYQRAREQTDRMKKMLGQYLMQKSIGLHTQLSVFKQLALRLNYNPPLIARDIKALELLSKPLQTQIAFEAFYPQLKTAPLNRLWEMLDKVSLMKFCEVGVEAVVLAPHDILFTPSAAQATYIVTHGVVKYNPILPMMAEEVKAGTWISEAAMWVEWSHVGTAEALVTSEVMALNAQQLAAIALNSRIVKDVFLDYSVAFHMSLIAVKPPAHPWPSDLFVPTTGFNELLSKMSQASREVVGLAAIEVLREVSFVKRMPDHMLEKLTGEVINGECWLTIDANREVVRLIDVVALRLEHPDQEGMLLVQLGTWDGSDASPAVLLPGGKQLPGESPMDALRRIFDANLAPLVGAFDVVSDAPQVVEERSLSRSIGLFTRYKRTVHTARLTLPTGSLNLVETARSMISQTSGLSMFSQLPTALKSLKAVYLLSNGENTYFYGWMSQGEFEMLQKNDRLQQALASSLSPTERQISQAKEKHSAAKALSRTIPSPFASSRGASATSGGAKRDL